MHRFLTALALASMLTLPGCTDDEFDPDLVGVEVIYSAPHGGTLHRGTLRRGRLEVSPVSLELPGQIIDIAKTNDGVVALVYGRAFTPGTRTALFFVTDDLIRAVEIDDFSDAESIPRSIATLGEFAYFLDGASIVRIDPHTGERSILADVGAQPDSRLGALQSSLVAQTQNGDLVVFDPATEATRHIAVPDQDLLLRYLIGPVAILVDPDRVVSTAPLVEGAAADMDQAIDALLQRRDGNRFLAFAEGAFSREPTTWVYYASEAPVGALFVNMTTLERHMILGTGIGSCVIVSDE